MKNKIDLIAEIGWNHLGDMKLAKKMIVAASNSGADYVKFQSWLNFFLVFLALKTLNF